MVDSGRHPKLARGCRLRVTEQGDVLLMPESMLRMNGCGSEILKRCDGAHTVEQIVAELQTVYTGVEIEKLSAEVESFLARLKDRLAIVEV
ncbi:MAG: pyrroloquinoline quinone biosynthesis peptide chaperone PqqD [Candidatus Korobacteraceae bacterium]